MINQRKNNSLVILQTFCVLCLLQLSHQVFGFTNLIHSRNIALASVKMSSNESTENTKNCFNELPGDPSLLLVTNVDLGDKKLEVMKGKFF